MLSPYELDHNVVPVWGWQQCWCCLWWWHWHWAVLGRWLWPCVGHNTHCPPLSSSSVVSVVPVSDLIIVVQSPHMDPVIILTSWTGLSYLWWVLITSSSSEWFSDGIKPFQFCLLSSATVRTDSKPISSPQDTSLFARSLQWFNFPYLQFLLPQPQKRTFSLKIPSLSAQNKRKPSNTNTNRQLEYWQLLWWSQRSCYIASWKSFIEVSSRFIDLMILLEKFGIDSHGL